jgi:cardiolipin synthase
MRKCHRPFPPLAALLLALAGCASLPAVDADIAAAARTNNDPSGTLDLMRRQEERVTHIPFVAGNAVTLLTDGQQTYAALTAAIDGARRRIDMESYEFDPVEGARFGDLLLAKRAQGVEVNLIFDSFGSLDTPASLIARLRQGGVLVLEYHPVGFFTGLPLDLNRRDHRKLLVVDDAIAITGGVNINQVYDIRRQTRRGRPVDPAKLAWRDTDVRIEGPVVEQFERIFEQTWKGQHGPPLPPPPPPATRRGDALVQAIDGTPSRHRTLIYRTLLVTISLARTSIHLTTGFFAPTPDLDHALEAAARRGVDVEIVVPAHSSSATVIAAGRAHYEDLLEAGVKIFERRGVFLHAKTAVIDHAWATVGSANLDWRSVIYNNEINAVILDRGFAQRMEALFADDVAASRPIDPQTWARRSWLERIKEKSARAFEFLL